MKQGKLLISRNAPGIEKVRYMTHFVRSSSLDPDDQNKIIKLTKCFYLRYALYIFSNISINL